MRATVSSGPLAMVAKATPVSDRFFVIGRRHACFENRWASARRLIKATGRNDSLVVTVLFVGSLEAESHLVSAPRHTSGGVFYDVGKMSGTWTDVRSLQGRLLL